MFARYVCHELRAHRPLRGSASPKRADCRNREEKEAISVEKEAIKQLKALYAELRVIKEREAKRIEEAVRKLEKEKDANATDWEWVLV